MNNYTRYLVLLVLFALSMNVNAQSGNVKTLFSPKKISSGGYGAVSSRFTSIRGKYTHMAGIYGGWYVNHRFMLGLGMAASTNQLTVPTEFSAQPNRKMTWQYGQFGLMTEYVLASDKPIHVALQLFAGAGFTLQYQRNGLHDINYEDVYDENWFTVAEPGVQVEINLFKWMRFSPGISYRFAMGSDGRGLADKDLSAISYHATLKFGKF